LNDTITKLDEMVDGLVTAIPAAVADSIREALGTAFAAAVKNAVKEAVADAVKELNGEASKPHVPPASPTPPAPTKPSVWVRVKVALSQSKTWALKKAATVVARATLGWAIVRLIGISTIHSRTAVVSTLTTGLLTAVAGYALGPIGVAILLGMTSSVIAASAIWSGPAARILVAFHDE